MVASRFVIWNTTFSVKNEMLDDEHRKIMSALNRLYCLEKEEGFGPIAKSTLQDLMQYTERHCAHEEQMMKQCGYDAIDGHALIHHKLIQRTRELTMWIPGDDQDEFLDHIISLNDWWVNHIQSIDRQYIPVMQSGVERADNKTSEGDA